MALVLSRRKEEEIVIWDEAISLHVVVKVAEFRGEKVRLAFTAPRNIMIHRRETYDAIQRGGGEGDRQLPTGNSTGMLTAATLQE